MKTGYNKGRGTLVQMTVYDPTGFHPPETFLTERGKAILKSRVKEEKVSPTFRLPSICNAVLTQHEDQGNQLFDPKKIAQLFEELYFSNHDLSLKSATNIIK